MILTINRTIVHLVSRYSNFGKKFVSISGSLVCCFVAFLVVFNQYGSLSGLDPKYRITTSALCLLFAFCTTSFNVRLGLIGVMFALPLQPKLAWQIQQYFGYGRILGVHNSGLDLVAGFCLGALANKLCGRGKLRDAIEMPWPIGLATLLITASVMVAILRNLDQTASIFSNETLLYNLLHLRTLDWHDDYRPLFDWVAYGCAFFFIAVLLPILKPLKEREHYVFIPLLVALVIAAIVGLRQSFFGIGYTAVQMLFRSEKFGFMALGFQDDIHAFAGQMLIGAIGIFGYLYSIKNHGWRLILALGIVPLCWWALFLSKSKASFVLAVLVLLLFIIIWFFRHTKNFKKIALFFIFFFTVFLLFGLFNSQAWITLITSALQLLGVHDLEAFNLKLSYRPEVYVAGLKMFSLFPFFGMGQGEYYRQAANHDLTGSYFLSIQQNGENGHNYFLHTLVETGTIGGIVFLVMLLHPLVMTRDKRGLIPGGVALIAIFVGNAFAHSLLVRENLMLAAVMLALMYACTSPSNVVAAGIPPYKPLTARSRFKGLFFLSVFGLCLVFLLGGATKEFYSAKTSFPFTVDTQCFKSRPLDQDGWTAGLLDVPIASGIKQVTFKLQPGQLVIDHRPLAVEIKVVDAQARVVVSKTVSLTQQGERSFSINIPNDDTDSVNGTLANKKISLQLERCFIPRNLGINEDSRRLGLQIESITTH